MPVLKQNEVFAGRYILCQPIGEGGFSEVWKAKDQMADDAIVAIKIYAPDKGLDDYGVRQFRKEFSMTYHLTHPHLLKVYHFDISDGSPYLIMPFCPFGSLARVLRDEGPFSERQVALAMCQIGSALEELHRQDPSIIHQDIKPDNILVLNAECYLLADFGISSQIRHTLRKATSNMQSLTVAYAPPERFDRHPTSDITSDIFSLGVTLYEICTNTIPWSGAGGQCLLKGALVPVLPDNFSPELNELLEACMSVDRSKRPTAAELHAKGRRFLETGTWSEPKKKRGGQLLKKRSFQYLLAAAVALFALAGYWFYNSEYSSSAGYANSTASSGIQQQNSRALEDKIKTMEAQLVEANQRIVQQDSTNSTLLQSNKLPVAGAQDLIANKESELKTDQRSARQPEVVIESNTSRLNLELRKHLNQISDPGISKEIRSGRKQEVLGKFADGSVQVLDESEGTVKEYRAGVFLTILLNSPHEVDLREVKRDRNSKIVELRLSMKSLKQNL
ncbi:serine/threonine-protein kinase [Cesiribacter sp. SM1]|uniref:serine/threonine-protein kinase n=1 Tax=Cesiribacter sp. SM1 TaxID=2861196 RepID=UPI001CD5633F|nr:serine/threonine-protein kinase [Cesiribacter sp. SM1]